MRSSIALLALPVLVAGQEQFPFMDTAKGWFDKAQDFVKANLPSPVQAASAKTAEEVVTPITWENWRSTIAHSGAVKAYDPPEAWMVYITGGNKTCGGRCALADRAWNDSVTFLSKDPSAPHLGSVDCEKQELLCGAWNAITPSVWVFLTAQPKADGTRSPTPLTIHSLNYTTVSEVDITRIHTRKLYLAETPYTGALHPFDGWVAEYNLTDPMAMTLYYLSKIPSWTVMIGLSFFSRYFVNKRMPQPRPAAPAGGATPAAPARN